MASYSTWIVSIKAVFISTGVAAMALFLKVSVPLAVDFSLSQAPILWSSLLSLTKPPYLYVVINGIIITIAASSRFRQSNGHRDGEHDEIISGDGKIHTEQIFHQAPPRKPVAIPVDPIVNFDYNTVSLPPRPAVAYDDDEKEVAMSVEAAAAAVAVKPEEEEEEEKEKSVVMVESTSFVRDCGDESEERNFNWNYLPSVEKPLVSARFGHRKSLKGGPEGGRALRVAKPKRHETLENTWKMITEGKSSRHLRKADTWQNHGRHLNLVDDDDDDDTTASAPFKKSETFKDRTNYQSPPPPLSTFRLRKEPSLSQDELNRRVEAFIKKFNEDMRLQRLESLKQYQEMISRGVN